MRTPRGYIEKLSASWDGWQRGHMLTPDQRAAWVRASWQAAPSYTVTQPADPKHARRTWRRAVRVWHLHHKARAGGAEA